MNTVNEVLLFCVIIMCALLCLYSWSTRVLQITRKVHTPDELEKSNLPTSHHQPRQGGTMIRSQMLPRFGFDRQATGLESRCQTPNKVLNRAIFLETVAAIRGMIRGMVAAIIDSSLSKSTKYDEGWRNVECVSGGGES